MTAQNKRLVKSIGNTLSLDFFTSADHGLVTVEGSGVGFVDEALAERGLKRNIVARIPNFRLVSELCAVRDILIAIPQKLAKRLASYRRLKILSPPIPTPPASTYLYWHPRNHTDPTNKWLRQLIYETCVDPNDN
ncbi:MAG: LysR substrate-binding domain-containing protein [Pseudomonadota bacterium]